MKSGTRVLLFSILLIFAVASLKSDETGDAAIAAKARELAPAETSTTGRIVAIHRFVRDEIRQVTTQYG